MVDRNSSICGHWVLFHALVRSQPMSSKCHPPFFPLNPLTSPSFLLVSNEWNRLSKRPMMSSQRASWKSKQSLRWCSKESHQIHLQSKSSCRLETCTNTQEVFSNIPHEVHSHEYWIGKRGRCIVAHWKLCYKATYLCSIGRLVGGLWVLDHCPINWPFNHLIT